MEREFVHAVRGRVEGGLIERARARAAEGREGEQNEQVDDGEEMLHVEPRCRSVKLTQGSAFFGVLSTIGTRKRLFEESLSRGVSRVDQRGHSDLERDLQRGVVGRSLVWA